jgi:hypothetical protein
MYSNETKYAQHSRKLTAFPGTWCSIVLGDICRVSTVFNVSVFQIIYLGNMAGTDNRLRYRACYSR